MASVLSTPPPGTSPRTARDTNTISDVLAKLKSEIRSLPPTPARHGKHLSAGAKAGIGVSVSLVVLSVVGFFLWRYILKRRQTQRLQSLRRESERGMRNAAVFQSALPPSWMEVEASIEPPDPPAKPPKAALVDLAPRGRMTWFTEKEVVVDFRGQMGRFSWRKDKPKGRVDEHLLNAGYIPESPESRESLDSQAHRGANR